jgi:hypothetical protein
MFKKYLPDTTLRALAGPQRATEELSRYFPPTLTIDGSTWFTQLWDIYIVRTFPILLQASTVYYAN